MGELRSQDLTIAGWIINLPLATVGHHTGGPGIRWTHGQVPGLEAYFRVRVGGSKSKSNS